MLNLVKSHRPPSTKVFGVRGADRDVIERMVVVSRMAPHYVFINVAPDATACPLENPR